MSRSTRPAIVSAQPRRRPLLRQSVHQPKSACPPASAAASLPSRLAGARRLLGALALLALLPLPAGAANDDPTLFTADGYRQSLYRSPTPERAEHAVTLDTAALQKLLAERPETRLIDVYRRPWVNGRFVNDEEHRNIPGSLWLANTGDGQLTPQWQAYFADNLARISAGRRDLPLVFYCRSDCWLSWNAVRRAHALGYTSLYWYRDGIDAWEQAGLPLHPATPQELSVAR
ncbi:PQQ-dependent catabolism-associated CXXCW motif protein [Zestomonas thermotolerans]|uniref:PQQ-dependent catabolism-associated CXXCW motif protein n=1 Tax=Zestomonas thermotolerans TaxID=157784 RepID=UPI0023F15A1E|nr:PQQ-dependent catabolism-associated CXXCW motif protein [Pseudomonas thermotolerans]